MSIVSNVLLISCSSSAASVPIGSIARYPVAKTLSERAIVPYNCTLVKEPSQPRPRGNERVQAGELTEGGRA